MMRTIWKATVHMTGWGLLSGFALGAIHGTTIAPIIGTVIGALYGASMGFGLGIIDGLLIGVVSRVFFHWPRDPVVYRWVAGILAALIPGLVMFRWMLFGDFNVDTDPEFFWFWVMPGIYAAIAAAYASQRFANWYLGETPKHKKKKRRVEPPGTIWQYVDEVEGQGS